MARLRQTRDQIQLTADYQRWTPDPRQQRADIAPLLKAALPRFHRAQVHREHILDLAGIGRG